jgi:serine/threonine-protein kinase
LNEGREQLAGVREGEILAGKYRVERVLGVGGMGVVVAARHIELDSRVALKFLLPSLLHNREAVTRFARESRAAVKIQSEHVARVLDVGTLHNGAPYMVMEYLEGGDLSAWLQERGPLPVEQAVDFVLQASVAVADAHGLGIIHRDLKPANLFCIRRSDGQFVIKVLDFGISKLTDAARASEPPSMSVTKTSAFMGSPLYMSPEQIQSAKDVDPRADLWALGVILFELLTRTVPFPGESFGEIAVKIAARDPMSLRSYRPDVPPALEEVIGRCLAKERGDRYANVGELALALLPFAPKRSKGLVERITGIIQAAGLSQSALAMPPSPEPVRSGTQASARTPPPVTRTTMGSTGRAIAIMGGGLGATAAMVALVVSVVFWKRGPAHGEDSKTGASQSQVANVALSPTPQAQPAESPKPVDTATPAFAATDAATANPAPTAIPSMEPPVAADVPQAIGASRPPLTHDSSRSASGGATPVPVSVALPAIHTTPAPGASSRAATSTKKSGNPLDLDFQR